MKNYCDVIPHKPASSPKNSSEDGDVVEDGENSNEGPRRPTFFHQVTDRQFDLMVGDGISAEDHPYGAPRRSTLTRPGQQGRNSNQNLRLSVLHQDLAKLAAAQGMLKK